MTPPPKIIVSTWNNGLFVLDGDDLEHELAGLRVRGLAYDGEGGVLASVDNHHLYRRNPSGEWGRIASSDYDLSAIFAAGGEVYVGTDDARVLHLNGSGELTQIDNFDTIDGRDTWFAGTAMINGVEVGPPLGVRSMSGTSDGCLFANVHVGGIARSEDKGAHWAPTIDVNLDAHEVRVSPYDESLVVAATAFGLAVSHDSGISWNVQTEGLHAHYCSAVAITKEHIFVAASEDHFTKEGAVYRRSVEPTNRDLEKVGSGLSNWLSGIADTYCIAADANDMAIVSAGGDVFMSSDAGASWLKRKETIKGPSSVLIVRDHKILS